MARNFIGEALHFSEGAIADAAAKLGVEIAAVRAVMQVESHGGFMSDRRPKILFERHYFSRLTGRKFDASHPDISSPTAGGYSKTTAGEYERLARAYALDPKAAIRSASWGAFQVMGDNCDDLKYAGEEAFCDAMCRSEDDHLEAFVRFVKHKGLDDELRRRDWAGFARGYNGSNYKQNKYDTKMAAAYAAFAQGGPRTEGDRILSMGAEGPEVTELQQALKAAGQDLGVDGDFGPTTKRAVIAFQTAHGLVANGIVGATTWRALGA